MFRSALLMLLPAVALAAPVEMVHQGRLLDAAGSPVNGTRVVVVRLTADPTGDTSLWSEPQTVRFEDGYYSVVLGSDGSNPLDSDLFTNTPPYVEVALDGAVLEPRTRLHSVPYAAMAATAAVASEVEGGNLTGPITIDGTLSASPPIADGDVTTKAYVDGVVDAASDDVLVATDALAADLQTLLQRGAWRSNCHADSSGWSSVDACIHDGRWHQVAEIAPDGSYTQGSYAELRTLAMQSPDLRILVDDIQWHAFQLQFHAPATSGVDNSPAVWVRISPQPTTYSDASREDFQDKMILFPATGKPEWGQNWYGHCGTNRSWANYGFFEGNDGCNIERMLRNNWEADINMPVKVFMRF